jgi:hypothetical protein
VPFSPSIMYAKKDGLIGLLHILKQCATNPYATAMSLVYSLYITHCRCRGLLLLLITLGDTHKHASTRARARAHTHTHTLGSSALDQKSARRRDLYLTTQNIHNRQTDNHVSDRIRARNPPSEQPQTHALDLAATEIACFLSEFNPGKINL